MKSMGNIYHRQQAYLHTKAGQQMMKKEADNIIRRNFAVDFECDNSCDGCPFNSWSQSWEGEWECDGEYGDGSVKQSDFGKTVFLTREEAEAALEKMREGEK